MTALLTDNLPLLADSPNGIRKLRELILELAVRGKLVAQDPSDEPASELLKRIAEEKARLVADGSTKKQKQLPGITQEETPFDVPAGWCWVRMGAVGETNIGLTYSPSDVGDIGIPVLRSSNVQKGQIDLSDLVRVDMPVKDSALVQEGDLLICARNGSKALVGKTAMVSNLTEPMAFGAFMAIFRSKLNPYLLRFINSPLFRKVIDDVNTTTINQITQNNLRTTLLPLPPIAEQHRIVAKVDELMVLCDRLEARQADAESAHARLVQALLDSLTQARDADDFAVNWQRLAGHFNSLFTSESSIDALKQTLLQLAVMGKLVPQDPSDEPASELLKRIAQEKARLVAEGKIRKQKPLAEISEEEKPFGVPKGWGWVRLETIAEVGTGATPLRTNPKYFEPAEFNWVTSGETNLEFISEAGQKVSSLALKETNLTVYPPHTLIMAMYGQGKTRGQISELLVPACTNQACAAIQLINPDEGHRQYVKLFFIKSYEDIRQMAAGGAQPNLNLGKIKETVLPIPPLSEQHRIVAKLDELLSLCDQLKARLATARQLHERLAGALVEQAVA